MIDHLLRLYPAAYRRAHGAEIAATYRELTAGEPLGPRLRDAAELAGHALRLRAGLGPGTAAARMLGAAYPLVLAASAAASGLHLLRWYAAVAASPAPLGVQLRSDLSGVWGVLLLSSLLVLAAAAAVTAWRNGSRGGDSRGARELAVRELAALALASPLLLAQAGTVAWGDPTALAVLATVLAAALAAVPLAGRLGRSRR
ncbi:hypothetical protein ACFXPX_37210 [Kitasatospora sp. NPDC059146]|uniref:hypothetical protein n=1 Tax=Kitasatospora sp. NPDC059146 TaxID=3346741 RepID=UPI0036B0C375